MPPAWGQKAILVTGKQSAAASGALGKIQALLNRYGVQVVPFPDVSREPTVAMVDAGAKLARDVKPKLVVSVGGGSVIDCAKAVAALAVNEGSVEDYLEGVGRGLPVANAPLPHIAIPTVSGTGAEMTKNAVIVSLEKGYKKSMRADSMIPTIALIDPLLTMTVPRPITAAGGMDAITQLFEPCITLKRRPETTMLALEGLAYRAHGPDERVTRRAATCSRANRWRSSACSAASASRTPDWRWPTASRPGWARFSTCLTGLRAAFFCPTRSATTAPLARTNSPRP